MIIEKGEGDGFIFYKKFGPEYPWRKLPRPQREKEERE
jgi:hypothetical protein